MRLSPATDTLTVALAHGATTTPGFDSAYHELADARAAYDAVVGDPDRVPELAAASVRLAAARRSMHGLSAA